jgi:hypothetical protein
MLTSRDTSFSRILKLSLTKRVCCRRYEGKVPGVFPVILELNVYVIYYGILLLVALAAN